jgi:predicted  nucleic acid-binding Zn-ribbon protein
MNVDEAIAYSRRDKEQGFWSDDMHKAMVVLAAEVERLRVELAVEREAVKSLGNSFDKLRDELWETKVENTHWEESHDRIEAELAEAKKDKSPPQA